MHTIRVSTTIAAPPERCFDLARSVDLHVASTQPTGERAVEPGRTAGLLQLNEEVTWEGRHFGVRQRLTSRITAYDRPAMFQDRIVRGAFRYLEHDHLFESGPDATTVMTDIVRFAAPLGPLGWLAERLVLGPYLTRFLRRRGEVIRDVAQSQRWQNYVR